MSKEYKYESPIKLNWEDIAENFENVVYDQINDSIVVKVRSVMNIDIDKEELAKVLEYDRDQYYTGYDEGYNDGRIYGAAEALNTLKKELLEKFDRDIVGGKDETE
jgi:hypothetical protein